MEGFAPPEQYGFMQTDRRSDIYSFGVTMREILGKNADEPAMQRMIAHCTEFDPERRYGSISAVRRALKSAERPYLIPCGVCAAAVIAGAACAAVILSEGNAATSSDTTLSDVISKASSVETSDEASVPAEFTFETVRGGNGMYRDVFDYVFIDDPQVYGKWELSGVFSDDTDLSLITAESAAETRPYTEMFIWKSYEFSGDGTYTLRSGDGETLADGRWTSGYCITQDSGYEFVRQMFIMTLDDGGDHLFIEQKPTGNYVSEPPRRFLMYSRE